MTDDERTYESVRPSRRQAIWLGIAGVIVVAVAIFVGQNGEEVSVSFLWFSGEVPLWLLIVVALVLGAILGQVGLYLRRRSKRRAQPED